MRLSALLREPLERLIAAGTSFAMWRAGEEEEPRLVMQTDGGSEALPDVFALNGRNGFVLAPFRVTDACPVMLIRPDVCVSGLAGILRATRSLAPAAASVEPADPGEDTKARYRAAFDLFHSAVSRGELMKLVLARRHAVALRPGPGGAGMGPVIFYGKCRGLDYICHTPQSGLWMGRTPERLLTVADGVGRTVALAGTMPAPAGLNPDAWDAKNRREQAYVAEFITRCLSDHGYAPETDGPRPVRAGNVVHLCTDFDFPLRHTHRLGTLLAYLHPTPAVCGYPKEEAYRFIAEHEGLDRRYYAGFLGWLDPAGRTDLYVNLRCMEWGAGSVHFYAGGGIMPESEWRSEWNETALKMRPLTNYFQ